MPIDNRIVETGFWNYADKPTFTRTGELEPAIPVPNTREGRDWWYRQAAIDIERTINLCVRLAVIGHNWANDWADRLIEDYA